MGDYLGLMSLFPRDKGNNASENRFLICFSVIYSQCYMFLRNAYSQNVRRDIKKVHIAVELNYWCSLLECLNLSNRKNFIFKMATGTRSNPKFRSSENYQIKLAIISFEAVLQKFFMFSFILKEH